MNRSQALADAEQLAARWLRLAEADDLVALVRALAVGKARMAAAREAMRREPARYRDFQARLAAGLASASPRLRFGCAHALDTFGDEGHAKLLASLVEDPVPRVRWMAMHALTFHACGDKAAALDPTLVAQIEAAAVRDESPRVRRHAGWALVALRAATV